MAQITTTELDRSWYRISSGTFRLETTRPVFNGSLNNFIQAGSATFQRWVCDFNFVIMERKDWQPLEAFFTNIQDGNYAFTLYDSSKALPLGEGAGFDPNSENFAIVDEDMSEYFLEGGFYDGATHCHIRDEAKRHSNIIVVKNLPANTLVLRSGDNFSLGGNLYQTTGDCRTDANGEVSIYFKWKLHKPALPNDIINFRNPTGRFILVDPESGVINKLPAHLGEASALKAIEVPYYE